jgi:hypothetical protein
VAPPLLKVLKDLKSARKVSYDEPFAVPKGYSMSFDRQETRSTRCVVGPVISALKAITPQAEGPRWMLAALLLLAADIVLAIIAWLIVVHVVR